MVLLSAVRLRLVAPKKQMNNIIYRKAQTEDIDELYRFSSEKTPEYFSDTYTKKTLDHFVSKKDSKEALSKGIENGLILLALDSGRIIGYLSAKSKVYAGVWLSNWIMVDQKYRGQGIATHLIKQWEEEGIKRGAHCLMLFTENRNIDFYKKRGFTLMGIMKKGYYGADDVWFYRIIQEPKEENYLQ